MNKKIALIIGWTVVLLTGCTEGVTDDAETIPSDRIVLSITDQNSLSPESAGDTRGVSYNETTDLYSIGLFGLKHTGASYAGAIPDNYINNSEVYASDDWVTEYSWPGNAWNVTLFAYAPYATADNGIEPSTGTTAGAPILTYTVPDGAENMPDLMVATSATYDGDYSYTVPLQFKHLLARVKVKIFQGTVGKIKFKNLYNKGIYSYAEDKWTETIMTSKTCEIVHEFTYPLAENAETPDEVTFFMMPQTLPEHAEIELILADGTTKETKLIAGDKWEAGESYEYTLRNTNADFGYTKYVETFTAIKEGTYRLQVWGCQGVGTLPGKGGYSTGNIYLTAGQELYVCVGGYGVDAHGVFEGYYTFGYNGGGTNGMWGCCGGGATHIAKTVNLGELKNYSSAANQANVVIVAGGGGGNESTYNGGAGGGASGQNGTRYNTGVNRNPTGGSQTAAGLNGWASGYTQVAAKFGVGGYGYGKHNTSPDGWDYGGSGGGGWYGGGGCAGNGGGAGGSGYIGGCLNDGVRTTIIGTSSFPAPNGSDETGHSGLGYARIRYIGS